MDDQNVTQLACLVTGSELATEEPSHESMPVDTAWYLIHTKPRQENVALIRRLP